MVIGDRITKKIMTHDVNTSPTALSKKELEGIIDDLEGIAARCPTFDDVIRFLMDIENREHNFDDPFGFITRVDAICSKYNRRQAIEAMRKELPETEEITELIQFIEQSERGIIR